MASQSPQVQFWARYRTVTILLLVAALTTIFAAIGWRVYATYQSPAQLDSGKEGYCDFHNGVYFPALAFREGVSPYGREFQANYPIVRPMALYGPAIFAVHLPFTAVDLPTADWLHFGFQIVCTLTLASLCLSTIPREHRIVAWLAIACLIAASRSGYGTLVTGYFTLLLVIGTVLAWQPHRPMWLRALGYAIAACKPTYAIPLSLLLIARRQFRPLFAGLIVFAIVNAAAGAWLLLQPDASLSQLLADLREGQAQHVADPSEFPVNSWTRIDLLAIVAKWMQWKPSEWQHLVAMLPLIAVPMWLLWRGPHQSIAGSGDATPTSVNAWAELVAMLAMVVTVYHHYYDLLVVVPSLVAIALPAWLQQGGGNSQVNLATSAAPAVHGYRSLAFAVAILILICLLNYGSAKFVLNKLDLSPFWFAMVTSMNGVVLALALVIACWGLKIASERRAG